MREKPKGWVPKLIINTIGALISFMVTIVFFLTKFPQVWPVLIFLPLIVIGFHKINRHYQSVGEQLRITTSEQSVPIKGNVIIVPVAGITTGRRKFLKLCEITFSRSDYCCVCCI